MGTDDLFRKRQAKSVKKLDRNQSKRAPYEKVLIVCEGKKSEPNYFNSLRDHYRLNTANVEVCGSMCGSNPMRIVSHAKERYEEDAAAGNAFDRVYCVFDKDTHADYEKAVAKIRDMKPEKTYFAITSVPCFEYWLLLHFTFTTRPYSPLPGNSACNQVFTELKKHIPKYEKGSKAMFPLLINQLTVAKDRAARAMKSAKKNGTDNPSTDVHQLVDFLQNIALPQR